MPLMHRPPGLLPQLCRQHWSVRPSSHLRACPPWFFSSSFQVTMLCCSSCGLPIQGHQLPMGPRCSWPSLPVSLLSRFLPPFPVRCSMVSISIFQNCSHVNSSIDSGLDDGQTLEIVDRKLSLAPKCKSRHLSMSQIWLKAWHIYEDTILSFFPNRYQELLHYQHHIMDVDQCFNWAAMLSYDAQFHHKCTMQGLPFSAFDQQLYMTMLDTTATKVSAHRCFRCQCFDHEVINCPFPLGGPLEKDSVSKKAAQSQQGQGTHQRHQQQHSFPWGVRPSTATCPPPRQGDLCQVPVQLVYLPQLWMGPCL